MMVLKSGIGRRARIDLSTPAEIAIRNAMREVEKMSADTRLTNAVIKLQEAFNHVADYIDDQMATK